MSVLAKNEVRSGVRPGTPTGHDRVDCARTLLTLHESASRGSEFGLDGGGRQKAVATVGKSERSFLGTLECRQSPPPTATQHKYTEG